MKKRIAMVLLILGISVSAVYAGGDKTWIRHHGDDGLGAVVQHQVRVNNVTP